MNFEIIINSIIAAVGAAAMVNPSEVETEILTTPIITTSATETTTTTTTTTTSTETEYTYMQLTKVVNFTECVDMVTVEDYNGKLWYFHGIEDWEIGDACILTIKKYDTEYEEDDEIIKTTYSAWDIVK